MIKKIGAFLLVLIIILLVSFDFIGKKITENYAQNILKTPVNISQFNSDWQEKSLNIDFITVQNPPKFNNKNAFVIEHLLLKLDDETSADLIVIDTLSFDGINFTVEQQQKQINLSVLIANLQSKKGDKKTGGKSNKRIKINNFSLANISIDVDTKRLKDNFKVPNIHFKNFGGNNGIPLNEMGKALMKSTLKALQNSLEKQGIEVGKQKIKQSLRHKIEKQLGIDPDFKQKFNQKGKRLLKRFGF